MPFPDRLQGGVTPPRRKHPAVCRICVATVGGGVPDAPQNSADGKHPPKIILQQGPERPLLFV